MTAPDVRNVTVQRLGGPLWRALRRRVEAIAEARADAAAERVRDELAELRREFGTARRNLRRDLDEVRDRAERMSRQLAAVEERLAGLERPPVTLDGAEAPAEARELLEDVRAEHARIRARLTAAALYEERLGRIERAVLPGGPVE
ncbi:MAG TPA: hypothetical protein VHJ17_26175 [Thermomonospora sp.]|nr:hypothetical protein [Thermomonospora sp.]